MSTVKVGNTKHYQSQTWPSGGPLSEWNPTTDFEKALDHFQIRIEGPGCGDDGVVMFGPSAVGELIIVDEPRYARVGWKITIEPRGRA